MIPVIFHFSYEGKAWQETTRLYAIPNVGDMLEIVELYNNPCPETNWQVNYVKNIINIDRTKHIINIHVTKG